MMWKLLKGRIAAAASCVGRTQVALGAALQYTQGRVQFGHALSEF